MNVIKMIPNIVFLALITTSVNAESSTLVNPEDTAKLITEIDALALMRTEDGRKIFSDCTLSNKIQQYDWNEATYLCEPQVEKPFFLPTLSWWQAILASGLIGMCSILWMERKKVATKTKG